MKEQDKLLKTFQELLQGKEPNAMDSAIELTQVLGASEEYLPSYEPNVNTGFASLQRRMNAERITPVVTMRPQRRWLQLAAAVALMVGALATFQLFFSDNNRSAVVATTRLGELQTVELADGSIVRLNENSTLSYPQEFMGNERIVQLTGEAFFDVTENAAHPFVIETDETMVRVLGTSFSVRAVKDEDLTKVVVKTGKVEVMDAATERKVTLQPFEEAIHEHGKKLSKVKDADLKDLAWHTLDFRKVTVSRIVKAMENHYDVSIDLSTADVTDCLQTINFADLDLNTTLEVLKTSLDINISQSTDNQYIVSDGTCATVQ